MESSLGPMKQPSNRVNFSQGDLTKDFRRRPFFVLIDFSFMTRSLGFRGLVLDSGLKSKGRSLETLASQGQLVSSRTTAAIKDLLLLVDTMCSAGSLVCTKEVNLTTK